MCTDIASAGFHTQTTQLFPFLFDQMFTFLPVKHMKKELLTRELERAAQ